MKMRKGLKDGKQSEMVREKSNFKRAVIHLKYFRQVGVSIYYHWSLVSGVGGEESLL